jgi:mannose-6-phosphate isomerase-like protein (cupin superfamily)
LVIVYYIEYGGLHMTDSATAAPYRLDSAGGERLQFGEVEVLIKASAASTGGAFTIFEENRPVDTGLHVHESEDEFFYVLEGEHVIQVGDEEFRVGPGDLVFAPRGVPHAQRRVVPRTGRLLVLTSPAGFEGFFRELAAAESAGVLGSEAYASASRNHGVTWLD